MFKRFFPLLLLIFLLWSENVFALTLGDLEYKGQVDFGGSFNTNGANNEYTITFPNSFTNSNKYDYLLIPLSNSYLHRGLTSDSFDYEVFSISYRLISSNANWLLCQADNGYLLCPLQPSATYTGLSIRVPNSFANVVQDNFIFAFYSQYGYFYNSITAQQTQDIIDSQQQQTQDIIDSQQQQTQDIIDSNKVCNQYDKVNIETDNKFLLSNGSLGNDNNFGISSFINIFQSEVKVLEVFNSSYNAYHLCFYDLNKNLISCLLEENLSTLNLPNNAYYMRFSINKAINKPQFEVCKNGNSAINDSINDSDTTQAQSSGNTFFDNFHVDNSRGFSNIITAPIRLVQGILGGSSSCTPLSMTIGMKQSTASTKQSTEVSLPCGSILWNNVPSTAVLAYWSTIFGLFSWFVLRDMYKFIDGIRDPDDKTEFVMSL